MKTIIDAGHGGKDPGALSPTGLKEADVALTLSGMVATRLEPHMEVKQTRTTDTYLTLTSRANIANDWKADLFVSIHLNSAESHASGFEVFTSHGQTDSDVAATHIFRTYMSKFPGMKARVDLGDGDPDKEAKFTVLTKTKKAAVLVETEFIHTPEGDAFFRDPSNLDLIADGIAEGILAYAGIAIGFPSSGDSPEVPVMTPKPDNRAETLALAKRIVALNSPTA